MHQTPLTFDRPPRRPPEPSTRERALEREVQRLRDLLRATASGGPWEETVEKVLATVGAGE